MKKTKQIFYLLINIILYFFSYLIPKKKSLWVFGAWFGQKYSDNPKAFFEYVNFNQKRIDAVWISKNTDVIQHVRSLGFQAHNEQSIAGMWYQLRSEFVFVCQSLHDDLYPATIGKKTKVINLWHGLPLKKIMYDVFGEEPKNKNTVGKLCDFFSPYEKHRNDYLIATSKETQFTFSTAFRMPLSNTLITGFPRNDIFLAPSASSSFKPLFNCIYMPTFRGGKGTECDLFQKYDFNITEIDDLLTKHSIQLTLRMHPVNRPPQSILSQIESSKMLKLDSGKDIYETIHEFDCLITDYSSIYFDFLLSNKPIVFAPFDLEEYKLRERSLYYNFEDVTLTPYCNNWPSVINRIIDLKVLGASKIYEAQYQELKSRFHLLQDKDQNKSFSYMLYNELINR
ncbi:CDP-glycerol glycerophosphotransferase family protein [Colwellia polaris]|jgi:CDP-glycerol glycerophosphotransferase (TagB/SpsB family)|uniref:CDP-glycerol glycerophosphotransferase family protein n=1 Tax=Colwellia polaris TaxID=326537 RepID=UPI000A1704E9|nr:CDP-glycerol glycerophosphotransferase family protein [Colwellia polaris]